MTAKGREIQVYEMNEDQIPSDWPRDFVAHSDHLRAVKLAQIEVVEETQKQVSVYLTGTPNSSRASSPFIAKLAALQKELEGPISAEPETTTNRIANRGWIDD